MAVADDPTEPTRTQLVTTGRADTAAAALLVAAITLFTVGATTDWAPRVDQAMFAAAIALCVLAGTMTLVTVQLRLDERRQCRAAQWSATYEVRHQAVIAALADVRAWADGLAKDGAARHDKLMLAIRTTNRLVGSRNDRIDELSAKHLELLAKVEELAASRPGPVATVRSLTQRINDGPGAINGSHRVDLPRVDN